MIDNQLFMDRIPESTINCCKHITDIVLYDILIQNYLAGGSLFNVYTKCACGIPCTSHHALPSSLWRECGSCRLIVII